LGREKISRCGAERSNKPTVNQRSGNARVAIFAMPSTRRSGGAISMMHAERFFQLRQRKWHHATVDFIAALGTVPDRTPPGHDRRDRGGEPAVGGRLSATPDFPRLNA
jgi:hypothetical protein